MCARIMFARVHAHVNDCVCVAYGPSLLFDSGRRVCWIALRNRFWFVHIIDLTAVYFRYLLKLRLEAVPPCRIFLRIGRTGDWVVLSADTCFIAQN